MLIRSGLLAPAAVPLGRDAAKALEMRTSNYQDTKLHGRGSRRCRSVDWSSNVSTGAIGSVPTPLQAMDASHQQDNNSATTGPVLKDQICLEQLVSMDQWQK
jgi:hypothetical protein